MKIKLLFFGIIADITGTGSMDFTDIKDTAELKDKILILHPAISDISFSIAVNKNIISDTTELKEGDEVAFLPPFAGG